MKRTRECVLPQRIADALVGTVHIVVATNLTFSGHCAVRLGGQSSKWRSPKLYHSVLIAQLDCVRRPSSWIRSCSTVYFEHRF
jgi:hypothetical protein